MPVSMSSTRLMGRLAGPPAGSRGRGQAESPSSGRADVRPGQVPAPRGGSRRSFPPVRVGRGRGPSAGAGSGFRWRARSSVKPPFVGVASLPVVPRVREDASRDQPTADLAKAGELLGEFGVEG